MPPPLPPNFLHIAMMTLGGPVSVLSSYPNEKASIEVMVESTPKPSYEVVYGGEDRLPPPPSLTPNEERRLWRKIDRRIMPVVTCLYLFSFLDRGNIGNARLQGLETQLRLSGSDYNIALSMYFVAYNFFSIPSNLLFKRIGPARFLSGVTVIWGIVATLMGLVKSYPQLVGVRICLGIAESGSICGVLYLLSMWYPRHMLHTRIGIFWAGATFAGAFSGLLAFAISFMSGLGGLLGWSWIFIIEGLATIVIGFLSYLVLVDLPETATFLTLEERSFVVHRKKYDNSSVGEEEHFEARHIKEALLDWQVWALSLVHMAILTTVYGIALFLPSIINGFGFSPTISQLLTVPVYASATIVVILWAIWGDSIKMRSPFDFMGLCLCAVGYGINVSNATIGVKYFGTFLSAIGAYGAFPATTAWLANNVSGHYKRAVALGVIVIAGNSGGIIASNVYRTQDAPHYLPGHLVELGVIGVGLIATLATAFTYAHINSRRNARQKEAAQRGCQYSTREIRRAGDRAPDFRYTL